MADDVNKLGYEVSYVISYHFSRCRDYPCSMYEKVFDKLRFHSPPLTHTCTCVQRGQEILLFGEFCRRILIDDSVPQFAVN